MKKILSVFCAIINAAAVFAAGAYDTAYQPKDKVRFEKYCEYIAPFAALPVNELIIKSAEFFLDAPYEGGTCELQPERLVINLHEFDCVTLVESCFALSRTVKSGKLTWDQYAKELTAVRYRNGKLGDYTTRLHYSSDWLYDNAAKGFVADINKTIGGEPLVLQLDFMSTHPDSYPALTAAPSLVPKIAATEKKINGRTYHYVPKEKFEKYASYIKHGDIVFFTTNIKGLDVVHAGIAYRTETALTFIDASSKHKKVLIEEISLAEYLEQRKPVTGILVARPL